MSDSISDQEIDAFMREVNGSTMDLDFWASIYDVFKYEGLDLRNVMRRLISKEKNKVIFSQDMQTFCVFGENRGTRISKGKVIMRTGAEGRDIIRRLQTKYNVVDTAPTSGDTITLGRIMACFPQLIARIRCNPQFVRTIGEVPDDLPEYLCFPGGAALIPHNEEVAYRRWLTWSKSFDRVINKQRHDPKKVEDYGKIVWDSPVVPDGKREAFLQSIHNEYINQKEVKRNADNTTKLQILRGRLQQFQAATTLNEKEQLTPEAIGGASTSGSMAPVQLGQGLFSRVGSVSVVGPSGT